MKTKKRTRRSADQIVADLQAEIERVRARPLEAGVSSYRSARSIELRRYGRRRHSGKTPRGPVPINSGGSVRNTCASLWRIQPTTG